MKALTDWSALAIQSQPSHPFRRVLMIVYAAKSGDEVLMRTNLEKLNSFAPDFIPSLFGGESRPLRQPAHMKRLLDGLRDAGLGP